eukprot:5368011-Pyramimonas_sp.AAC.1
MHTGVLGQGIEPAYSATGPCLLAWAALRAPPLPGALYSKSAPSRRCATTTEDKASASRSPNGKPSLREISAPRYPFCHG